MSRVLTAVYCVLVFVCLVSVSLVPRGAVAEDPPSGWGEAVKLEFLNALIDDVAYDPRVAADMYGNAFAVWYQFDGQRYCTFADRYVRGEGWTGPVVIDTASTYDCYNPWVSVDRSGNAFAVWQQFDLSAFSIWANMYSVGTGWGTPELIESQTEEAGLPQVVVDRSGNATVLWMQFLSGQGHIWSCRYVVGEGWGAEEEIEGYGQSASKFDVAVDDSGCVVAVWSQWEDTHLNVSANRYVPGEGWGAAEMIGGNASGDVSEPKVAVDPSGNAMAVWGQFDGVYSTWYSSYVVGEGWGPATLLESEEVDDALFPRIASDPSGNFLTVWQQPEEGVNSVWWSRYVPGDGWSAPDTVDTSSFAAFLPQVVVDRHGNGTALWTQSDGTLCSSRYVPGEGWGGTEVATTDAPGGAGSTSAAADGIGNVVAVWTQADDSHLNVWANTYFNPDTVPPQVSIEAPSDGLTLESPTVEVSGTTELGVTLEVNGLYVSVGLDGSFSCVISLLEGDNVITANATDLSGNWATDSVTVTYVNPVYALEAELADALAQVDSLQAQLDAALADLADLQAQLDEATGDVALLEAQLVAAEAALVAAEDELAGALAALAEVESQLNDSEADVLSLQLELAAAVANLTAAEEDLATAEEDLADVEEQLAAAEDDLDDSDSLNTLLMAGLVAALAVAAVMAFMYMRLRRAPGGGPKE